MPRRTLWLLLVIGVFSLACYERAERNPYGRWFAEVMETIDRYYVEPVDNEKLFQGALDGMVGKLDDYSSFLPRSEMRQFQESLDQRYGGIGIEVMLDGPKKELTVMGLLLGTPAYKAGIRAGDKIVSVEGRSTENLQLKDVLHLLRGKAGDEVTVSVRRAGHDQPIDFHLVRAMIKTDSVLGDTRQVDGSWSFMLPGDQRIGYVRISTFGEYTFSEFESALKWLTEQKCRGLILDLRNDPGGLLQSAERICNLFIPKDALIVSTRGRDARERDRYLATGDGPYQDLPLVVLVNDKSASASEIVAACLQDHQRATIVGERTWGKGTVQSVIPLEGGKSLLKLTIASYWRPSGKNIHRMSTSKETDEWGVKPDAGCEVKLDEKELTAWAEKRRERDVLPMPGDNQAAAASPSAEPAIKSPAEFDPQLQRAVEVLEKKIAAE